MMNALLLIDPQNDFVSLAGTLCVPGAIADCDRLASHLETHPRSYDAVFCTLDTHRSYHIAHAVFWRNERGEHPAPFTTIRLQDVVDRKWYAAREEDAAWAAKYVFKLETGGRFVHIIWPEHCIQGSEGVEVFSSIAKALASWETATGKQVNYLQKGLDPLTEHYSAFGPEVRTPGAPHAPHGWVSMLADYDCIYVAGEALSHCVNFTVRDLVRNVDPAKVVVLTDATSAIPGFETVVSMFKQDMEGMGVRFQQL